MPSLLLFVAGLGCSLCYGLATLLEQIAAKQQKEITSLNPKHLIGLFKQLPYVVGILLDFIGWGLFLIVARRLPLFLALSFVSFSLVITAIAAQLHFKIKSTNREKLAIAGMLIGLVLLGVLAKPSVDNTVSHSFNLVLELSPLVIGLVAVLALRDKKSNRSALVLASLSGISFGVTGLISRVVQLNIWHFQGIFQLLVLALVVNGALGAILLAAALQRSSINKVNSLLFSSELILPSLAGIIWLHDKVKTGLWPLMALGLIAVAISTVVITLGTNGEAS